MQQEVMTKYVENLLVDDQNVRSRCMEGYGHIVGENDKLLDFILADMEPWLFGEKNILPAILHSLKIGVSKIDILNFSIIVRQSPSLTFYRQIGCEETEPSMRTIFKND